MTKEPYKVKLTPYRKSHGELLHRQSKNHKMISSDGRYQFFIDENIDEADFWIMHGKGVRQPITCKVAPENTVLLTTEPYSIFAYPKSYTKQFGVVHSSQIETKHKKVIHGPAIIPWYVGYTEDKEGKLHYTLDYDTLKDFFAPQKTKLISVITSNKVTSQGHIDRIHFVEKLKEHYGDQIDVFGRGIKSFDDKWEVLAPYKYHIAIENSSTDFYWTEKLADCYLAETFPIYYGCTNIQDYFPEGAYEPIDIFNFDGAIKIIGSLIANDRYEKSKEILTACKNKVLDEYNIFDYAAKICDTLNPELQKKEVVIKPCVSVRNSHNFLNYTFKRHYYKFKKRFLDFCNPSGTLDK